MFAGVGRRLWLSSVVCEVSLLDHARDREQAPVGNLTVVVVVVVTT